MDLDYFQGVLMGFRGHVSTAFFEVVTVYICLVGIFKLLARWRGVNDDWNR